MAYEDLKKQRDSMDYTKARAKLNARIMKLEGSDSKSKALEKARKHVKGTQYLKVHPIHYGEKKEE